MATSYINTGVLGQQVGGTLSIGGLQPEYTSFREEVLSNKRTISGITPEERENQRKRREARLRQSVLDTQVVDATGEVVREGVSIDTADISPPSIPVDPNAPPTVQQQQFTFDQAAKQLGIVTAPVADAAPISPTQEVLAPEKNFTDADRAFASAYSSFRDSLLSKNKSDVVGGRKKLQGRLAEVQRLAQETGREDIINAVAGIEGIAGQSHISARNVGQAKASLNKATSNIRGVLDIDTLMRESMSVKKPAAKATSGLTISKNATQNRLFNRLLRR